MKTKTFNTPNELDEYFDINTKTLDLLQFDLLLKDGQYEGCPNNIPFKPEDLGL